MTNRADARIALQDRDNEWDMVVREVGGDEKRTWWERAVAAFPPYADCQRRTEREIPLFVAEPLDGG